MKKNIAMRIAAFLFILTMISTCAFATTFAKYVSYGESHDSARVAKWGVTIDVTGTGVGKLFANAYDGTVRSFDDAMVVAPGTNGGTLKFDIKGTPEVSVDVVATCNLELGGWVINTTEEYCPLEISVKIGADAATVFKKDASETIDEFEARVEKAITDLSSLNTIEPNKTLDKTFEITWSWPFSTSEENDVKDTALGDLGKAPTITLDITYTITQKN